MTQEYNDWIPANLNDPDVSSWDGRSSAMEAGFYDFEVRSVGQGTSQKGHPTLVVEFEILTEGPYQGRMMKRSYSLLDKARGRLKNLLEALQAPITDDGAFSPSSLVGCRMTAEVTVRTYKKADTMGNETEHETNDLVGEEPYGGEEVAPAPSPTPAAAKPRGARRVGRSNNARA